MPHPLDAALDAALAQVTGPAGPLPAGRVTVAGQDYTWFAAAPPTLPEFFAALCARHADTSCLVDGSERLSYAQTYALARRLAGGLVAGHGVRPGDRVAIAARNGAGWVIAYMAILMAGGVATLVNGFWTGAEMDAAIADVGGSLVIADDRRAAMLDPAGPPVLTIALDRPVAEGLATLVARGGDETTPLPALTPDDNATILFTSGSTGRSKGAVSDHRAKVQAAFGYACAAVTMLGVLSAQGRPPAYPPATLLNLPLFHVTAEITQLLQSFVIGRKMVLLPRWDAEVAMRLIEAEKITYFTGVPLMGDEIVRHPRRGDYDLSSLADMAAGGAPRPVEHVRRIAEEMPGTNALLGYGLTETNAIGCANFREAYLAKPASTGRPLPPLSEVAIFAPDGTALPAGEVGEIGIRAVANVKGYWNRPAETAALFTAGHYLRTGDLGYLDEDGYLFIVDRAKDIIIRGGENIAAAEVEAALYTHAALLECAVFGVPHERYGEVPVAVVRARAGMALGEADLRAFADATLAPFKRPARYWIWTDPLPRLGTQKIDKRALRERVLAMVAARDGEAPPVAVRQAGA